MAGAAETASMAGSSRRRAASGRGREVRGAAYTQLQQAQHPYDAEAIQASVGATSKRSRSSTRRTKKNPLIYDD